MYRQLCLSKLGTHWLHHEGRRCLWSIDHGLVVFPKLSPSRRSTKFQEPCLICYRDVLVPRLCMQATQNILTREWNIVLQLTFRKEAFRETKGKHFSFWKFSLNQPRLSPRTGISNSIKPGMASILRGANSFRKIVLSLSFSNQNGAGIVRYSVFLFSDCATPWTCSLVI